MWNLGTWGLGDMGTWLWQEEWLDSDLRGLYGRLYKFQKISQITFWLVVWFQQHPQCAGPSINIQVWLGHEVWWRKSSCFPRETLGQLWDTDKEFYPMQWQRGWAVLSWHQQALCGSSRWESVVPSLKSLYNLAWIGAKFPNVSR